MTSKSKPADKKPAAKGAGEQSAQHPFVELAVALTNFVRFPSSPRPQTLTTNIDAALARVKAEGVLVGETGEAAQPVDLAAQLQPVIEAAVAAALPDLVNAAVAEAVKKAAAGNQDDLLKA